MVKRSPDSIEGYASKPAGGRAVCLVLSTRERRIGGFNNAVEVGWLDRHT